MLIQSQIRIRPKEEEAFFTRESITNKEEQEQEQEQEGTGGGAAAASIFAVTTTHLDNPYQVRCSSLNECVIHIKPK